MRTLYSCEAENESELSFEPNQIIQNGKSQTEPCKIISIDASKL